MVTVSSVSISQVGKIREHNEDAIFTDDGNGLWIVADGMGGHACGEVASQLAITTLVKQLKQKTSLSVAIEHAHQTILKQEENHPEQQGMGTTLVAAQLTSTGFNIGWAGDSRAYCFNGVGKHNQLKQITMDHSFVQDMVFREVLTPEEASVHPKNNLINRSLGMTDKKFKADIIQLKPVKKGCLLLCSDGVSDYISHTELEAIFKATDILTDKADAITKAVLNTEAADNFSFVLLEFEVGGLAKLRNKIFKP